MAGFGIPEGWTVQAFRFALDPSPAQVSMLESHCGAARFDFNHILGVVKANLDQRAAERSNCIAERDLTPAQGWSLPKLRKTWNQIKGEVAVVAGQSQGGVQHRFGWAGPRPAELVHVTVR
jgi:putative transposase